MRFLNWLISLFKKPAPSKKTNEWDPYWSEILGRVLFNNIEAFDKASDIQNIRKDWAALSSEQKIQVLQAFFKALAYYESGYDPLCESVDVGNKYDKETWSVGLLQLSGVDKSNLGLSVGFNYDGLKNPVNNLVQGVAIMVNQIEKRGKIIIPKSEKGNPGVYWATLNPGNIYDKTKFILTACQIEFKSVEKPVETVEKPVNETPWMEIARKEFGIAEISGAKNHPRIIEYHQATSLKAQNDETSWCAAFASWVLLKSGCKSPKTAWARDFEKYGTKLHSPKYGCIIGFERNGPGGDSHVAFYTGKEDENFYYVLGGNQNNSVCVKAYPKADVIYIRWPEII